MGTTLPIPITKAGNKTIEISTDNIPDEMYNIALAEGLKVLLNRGMSKVPASKGLEGKELEDVHVSAYTIAEKNVEKLYAGELKGGRSIASKDGDKVSGVVMTEARRLAKEVIKNEIKAAGMKISHVPAADITKAANALLTTDKSYLATAQANIEARMALVTKGKDEAEAKASALAMLQKLGGIAESPKLVKAAAERKAKEKAEKGLSKTQAGIVAPRKKGEGTGVHHAN